MKNRTLEISFGIVIIITLISFVLYTAYITISAGFKTYTINAQFFDIGGLTEGSKVIINGYKIGKVSSISLSKDDYSVWIKLSIDKEVSIPSDSKLEIKASGLFDPPMINVILGNAEVYLEENSQIIRNKDWVSLEDKIGNLFFSIGSNK